MCSHLCTNSQSYIRYLLNFLSVVGRFTIEQLSFKACFGGLFFLHILLVLIMLLHVKVDTIVLFNESALIDSTTILFKY